MLVTRALTGSWAVAAAGAWSFLVAVLGVLWATDLIRSPFGVNDPRAEDVGSYLGGLEPTQTGLVAVGVGLAGVLTAFGLWRLPGRGWPVFPALCVSFVLVLVVPDGRVVQNFAYLFFLYTGLWDSGLAAMLVSMVGGLFFGMAALAHLVRGRSLLDVPREPRWAVAVTCTAAALALPYPIVRIAWSLGLPLGVPADYLDGWGLPERLGVGLVLGGLPVMGAILTIGLIRPWGEIFPRWIPRLRGRRVPIWVAVIPGLWAAALISQGGLRTVTWSVGDLGGMSWDSWGAGLPGLFFLPWGLTLAAAVYAYTVRRLRHDVATNRRPGSTPT